MTNPYSFRLRESLLAGIASIVAWLLVSIILVVLFPFLLIMLLIKSKRVNVTGFKVTHVTNNKAGD